MTNGPTITAPDTFEIRDDPRLAFVVSCPRIMFSDFAHAVIHAVGELNAHYVQCQGAFWEQSLTKGVGMALDAGCDYLITTDFDTVFTPDDVRHLVRHMQENPHLAAVFATQQSRHHGGPLVNDPSKDYSGPLTEKDLGHFGLSVFRRELFESLERPWFWSIPNEDGEWGEGRVDADITFWRGAQSQGYRVAQANDVVVGHLETCVMWPHESGQTAMQLAKDYRKQGRPAGTTWNPRKHDPLAAEAAGDPSDCEPAMA